MIYYVGETGRSFSVRMLEHFKEHMSGGYHLYKPEEYKHGIKVMLWPGRYDPERKTTVAEFLQNFSILERPIEDLAKLYRFYIAPMEYEIRLRERVEACLANHLYIQEGVVGELQDKGIRYNSRLDTEVPVQVFFEADARLIGIPAFLWS